MHAPGNVTVEEREDPRVLAPGDAVLRLSATCICGSDLWPWRGIDGVVDPRKVFDLELPLDEAAEGYRAMDERPIKTLLWP
jgi:threonine dehydrogenase-like Zn-dependent dehydrogenase